MEKKPLECLKEIEAAELELTRLNAARSLVPMKRELKVTPFGASILLRDCTDPASIYYNRVKGFGPRDLPDLDRLLKHYPLAAPSFELTPNHMTKEVTRALCDKGFFPVEQLVYMYACPKTTEGQAASFPIERVTEESAEEFIRWIGESVGGMKINGAMMARSKPFFCRPDFINYMLRIDGSPAAMGSLFLHGEAGYIANDYTFPTHRGKGCQKALLAQRLGDAARMGAKAVYTDVMFGSASHANMVKAGFRISHVSTFWVKQ
ncbi:GNAT family N-acetyltransferase [Paenibacillus sp. YN15]|uniref:GNAT family N-acetyltransferase n=1 Tax=Paenibacillus sp. YN15 TaxID=1742774 RepID=UPI0015EBE17B|nr:GNAT family N-acetyltransferase [Paenibacillus sp. YN15]